MQCVHYSWDQVLKQHHNVEWLLLFKRHSIFFTGLCPQNIWPAYSLQVHGFQYPKYSSLDRNLLGVKNANYKVFSNIGTFVQLRILTRSFLTSMHTMSVKSSLSIFPPSGTFSWREWACTPQWVSNFIFEFQLLDEHQGSSPDNGIWLSSTDLSNLSYSLLL